MLKEPTLEQQNIINCNGNIVVTARPGSGKTFTVVEKVADMLADLPSHRGIIAISYTNKASDELKYRCKQKGIETKRSFFGTIDKFFLSKIIIPFASHITGENPEYRIIKSLDDYSDYKRLTGIERIATEDQKNLIKKALAEGLIFLDLSGQIALFLLEEVPGVMTFLKARYSYIFIDEYQDCGAVQHELFMLLVGAGICGMAVGDKDQAIYAFANRHPKYLLSLIQDKRFNHFELTKNHRCNESIIEYSLCLLGMPGSIPSQINVFEVHVDGYEKEIAKQIDAYLSRIKDYYLVNNNNQIAILGAKNSTLKLIAKHLTSPFKLFKETALDNDDSEWGRLFRDLLIAYFSEDVYPVDVAEDYFYEEFEPKLYRKTLNLIDTIFSVESDKLIDQVDSFVNFADMIYPGKRDENAIHSLKGVLQSENEYNNYKPAASNEINLLTLHKSKGLEFNIVFHLDLYEWSLPYKNCTKEEYTQAMNLHYVGVTRAINACFLMQGTFTYNEKAQKCFRTKPSPFLSIHGLSDRKLFRKWG